jgi:hypothetical protein
MLSSSFAFLQSLSRPHLAESSRRDDCSAPLLSFASLQHIRGEGIYLFFAGLPHPLGSALRVWLPSRRFAPPKPAPALFHADSTLGIPPFGVFPSRKVSRAFPPAMNPRAVSPAAVPSDESSGRNGRPRLPGFDPSGSPSLPPGRLAPPTTGYSLGLRAFPGRSGVRLASAPAPAPLTRLRDLRQRSPQERAPQGINRRPLDSIC